MGLFGNLFGEEAISHLKQQLLLSDERNKRSEATINVLSANIQSAREDIAALENSVSEKEFALKGVNTQLQEYQSQIESLQAEFAAQQQSMLEKSTEASRRALDLEAEINSLQYQLIKAKETVDQQRDEWIRMVDAARQKEIENQTTGTRLKEQAEKLLTDQQGFQRKLADLNNRERDWALNIEPRLREYETHCRLDERQSAMVNLSRKLKSQKDSMEVQQSELKSRIFTFETEMATKSEALEKQQHLLDERARNLEDWARELSGMQSRVRRIDSDTEMLERRKREIETNELERQSLLTKRLSEVKIQQMALDEKAADLAEETRNLRIQKDTVERESAVIERAKEKNSALRQEVKALSSKLKAADFDKNAALIALSTLKSRYESLQGRHASSTSAHKSVRYRGTASSLLHPTVLRWLLLDGDSNSAAVANGWLGSTGYGPWDENSLESALEELDYRFYQMADPDLDHVIVGRKGWSKELLLAQIDARESSPLRIYSQEMFFVKLATGKDPFDSGDDELLNAFAEDHPALEFLKTLALPWPALTESEDGELLQVDGEEFGVSESPLHILGYRVGVTSDLTVTDRREILAECFESSELTFSVDSDAGYVAKWGRGGSAQRLYRMAVHIKSLIDGRVGKDHRKPQAKIDWINDLKWLKSTYFAKHKSRFSWPNT